MSRQPATPSLEALKDVIEHYWGYRTLRPLQEPAMRAVLAGRDTLVVLPTGGGKSLCYQAPAVLRGDTTVVVSPLIALMKDQVDGLRACGVAAAQINSSQTPEERFGHERDLRQGAVRLLFVSPERLVNTDFYQLLRRVGVRTFAIDEAHCISHWGHDFRPEYRQLSRIKELFPGASVHAYTATATEQVRRDITAQLALDHPEVLVGNFDRPNLTYRVLPRHDRTKQVLEVLGRHAGEAGIIYCGTRREVEDLTDILKSHGHNARRYHAGLTSEERRDAQNAFIDEEADLIVATVAFGMGIDRPDIRFVLHTGMPKSLEHYQQETGRAGRDSEPAECVLLHSGADFLTWKSVLEKSVAEGQEGVAIDPSFLPAAVKHLEEIDRYCRGAVCRHRQLVEYFGQPYEADNCGACDLCLGDTASLPNAREVAQKILSCIARLQGRFGSGYVITVLRGVEDERVQKFGHHKLSTFGLLKGQKEVDIRDWIYQLIGQKVLAQNEVTLPSGKTVPVLGLNEGSWEVMRGQRQVRLRQLVRRKKGEKAEKPKAEVESWEGVDRGLFDELRRLRRKLAEQRQVPPYVIFYDRTLRELARVRPGTLEGMRGLYGVGDAKLRDHGQAFLEAIQSYCRGAGLALDVASPLLFSVADAPRPEQAPAPEAEEPEAPFPAEPPQRGTVPLADSLQTAQKILSCVAKVKGQFPIGHMTRVLRGRDTQRVRQHGHEQLSTFGLLREQSAEQVQDWIRQLVEQGLLVTAGRGNPVLHLNAASWEVMRGQRQVPLVPLASAPEEEDPAVWERVDRELYAALAAARARMAEVHEVSPREILGDWILRELARVRPSSPEKLRLISGIGAAKQNAHGAELLAIIGEHCRARGLAADQPAGAPKSGGPLKRATLLPEDREAAFALYRKKTTVEQVMERMEWGRGKAVEALCAFIQETRPRTIDAWVRGEAVQRVAAAARQVGTDRLKPLYVQLGEQIPYDDIRVALAFLATQSSPDPRP